MIPPVLIELIAQFLLLSMLSIGGANAVIPEMHRRAVDVHHWMSDGEFAELFAIAGSVFGAMRDHEATSTSTPSSSASLPR